MFHVLTMACRGIGVGLVNGVRSGNLRLCLRPPGCPRWAGWAVLLSYLVFLVFWLRSHSVAGSSSFWMSHGLHGPAAWVEWLVLGTLSESAHFAAIGFLGVVIVARRSGWLQRVPTGLRAVTAGGIFAVPACAVKILSLPYPVGTLGLMTPMLSCLFGAWAGTSWLRGWRFRLWFLPKAACLALLTAFGAGLAVWLSLEDASLPFHATPVTSADKGRLADLVRDKGPGTLKEDETHTVCLTEHDVNVLLSWGFSLGSADRKAKVSLSHDSVSLRLSAAVPLGGRRTRYLNLEMAGAANVGAGILTVRGDRCCLGPRRIPRWFLRSACTLVTSRLNHDPQLRPFLRAAQELAIEPNMIRLAWGPLDPPAGAAQGLLGRPVASKELLASTRAQVDHLLILFAVKPECDLQPTFNLCLATAFALARERSADHSPVLENQAAILALGMLLGHPGIEAFIGPALGGRGGNPSPRTVNRVALCGRPDWARHFCLSAAITVLSQEAVGEVIGLLKEEIDTGEKGSGFSFADLLADRAGVALAVAATRDAAAALAMQDRLASGFPTETVFPRADDIPEGISDEEFESRYGGVAGAGCLRLIEEIERRIARCTAYQ